MEVQELFLRFGLLLISLSILIYFSIKKKQFNINPIFCIVSICTFMLCFLFIQIEIGLGIGFGLFAIFSILRFRTQTFTLPTIIFLFASITISILDCLFPIEKINILFFFQVLLLVIFMLSIHFNADKSQKFANNFEMILSISSDFELHQLRKIVTEKLHHQKFDFTVISINYISKQIVIKIFY